MREEIVIVVVKEMVPREEKAEKRNVKTLCTSTHALPISPRLGAFPPRLLQGAGSPHAPWQFARTAQHNVLDYGAGLREISILLMLLFMWLAVISPPQQFHKLPAP